MRTLLLFCIFLLAADTFSQEPIRKVSIDTLCECKIKFLGNDSRMSCNSKGILHARCIGCKKGDYFLQIDNTPGNKPGVYDLLNKNGTAMKRSSVFTNENGCIYYLIVDNDDGQWTYDIIKRIWSGPLKLTMESMNDPHEE